MKLESSFERLVGAAVMVLGLAVSAQASALGSDDSWRLAPIWDDGNAEYCAYEVTWSRYGELHPGRVLLVLVKEPWAPDLEVKADRPRADGFEVLKLNHIRDVPTGIYTYHQMASVFLRRDTGALRKLSVMSSEACGLSTAHMVDGVLETRSYFDGQGESRVEYPRGALAEDGLPATLRDYLEGPLPSSVEIVPSFMTGFLPSAEALPFEIERQRTERRGPVAPVEVVELRLERGTSWSTYAFDLRSPHPLVHHARDDGTEYRLAKCERIPYWRLNAPGDEEWLPASVR